MDLEDLLIESAIQLQSLGRSGGGLEHPGLVGRVREDFFKAVLSTNLLPARYAIGNGRVVGINGEMSREVDIIFYNNLDCPRFGTATAAFYPSLGVHGIAEIKSTLDTDKLVDSLSKIATFKKLYRHEPMHRFGSRFIVRQGADPKPFGIVFAYKSRTSLETLAANMLTYDKTLESDLRAGLVVVLDKGLIVRSDDGTNPTVVFNSMKGLPETTVVINPGYKTLGIFYQMLSELLVSVPTFPANPALYGALIINVGSRSIGYHNVGGQVREFDPVSRDKRTLSETFLLKVVSAVLTSEPTTIKAAESRAFPSGDGYVSVGSADDNVWIYDPDCFFDQLDFPAKSIPQIGQVRSLASDCRFLKIDDKYVLVPHIYIKDGDWKIEDRS